ncbi:unnamed protein product, partial [Hapterophycus canaliculatus]
LRRRALETWEREYGPEHPKLAAFLNNQATLRLAQGKPDEAEALGVRALEIVERAYGPVHPELATCLNNLSALLH